MHDPRVASDNGATRDEVAVNLHALRGYHALENKAWGWMEAERFLDHGVKVREFLGFGPRDGLVGTGFNDAVGDGAVEFLHELGVDVRVLDEEVEDGGEGNGSCFGSGKDHGGAGR